MRNFARLTTIGFIVGNTACGGEAIYDCDSGKAQIAAQETRDNALLLLAEVQNVFEDPAQHLHQIIQMDHNDGEQKSAFCDENSCSFIPDWQKSDEFSVQRIMVTEDQTGIRNFTITHTTHDLDELSLLSEESVKITIHPNGECSASFREIGPSGQPICSEGNDEDCDLIEQSTCQGVPNCSALDKFF